jgi:hypothetical protein
MVQANLERAAGWRFLRAYARGDPRELSPDALSYDVR